MDRTVREPMLDFAHRAGYIGSGVGVAVMDTGIIKHKDFDTEFWCSAIFASRNNTPMTITGMERTSQGSSVETGAQAVGDTVELHRDVILSC